MLPRSSTGDRTLRRGLIRQDGELDERSLGYVLQMGCHDAVQHHRRPLVDRRSRGGSTDCPERAGLASITRCINVYSIPSVTFHTYVSKL